MGRKHIPEGFRNVHGTRAFACSLVVIILFFATFTFNAEKLDEDWMEASFLGIVLNIIKF